MASFPSSLQGGPTRQLPVRCSPTHALSHAGTPRTPTARLLVPWPTPPADRWPNPAVDTSFFNRLYHPENYPGAFSWHGKTPTGVCVNPTCGCAANPAPEAPGWCNDTAATSPWHDHVGGDTLRPLAEFTDDFCSASAAQCRACHAVWCPSLRGGVPAAPTQARRRMYSGTSAFPAAAAPAAALPLQGMTPPTSRRLSLRPDLETSTASWRTSLKLYDADSDVITYFNLYQLPASPLTAYQLGDSSGNFSDALGSRSAGGFPANEYSANYSTTIDRGTINCGGPCTVQSTALSTVARTAYLSGEGLEDCAYRPADLSTFSYRGRTPANCAVPTTQQLLVFGVPASNFAYDYWGSSPLQGGVYTLESELNLTTPLVVAFGTTLNAGNITCSGDEAKIYVRCEGPATERPPCHREAALPLRCHAPLPGALHHPAAWWQSLLTCAHTAVANIAASWRR